MGHARLGPSNHRWPHCPGSVREESRYQDIPGEAAIDGTGSHVLLELCLINGVMADEYEGYIIGDNHKDHPHGWMIQSDRIQRVNMCMNYVKRRRAELKELYPDALIYVTPESISDPGRMFERNDWWGTCDITIEAIDNHVRFIEVVDYKDGRSYVSEKWNTQLISYLYGKMSERISATLSNDVGLRMTIVQPKTSTPIRYMCSTDPGSCLTLDSLSEKVKWLADCAAKADDPNAPLIPGKHCQWCKHNPKRGGSCSASTENSMEVINNMANDVVTFGDDVLKQVVSRPTTLSAEQLSQILDSEPGFLAAFQVAKDEAARRINDEGLQIPGYAMLPGKVTKVWNESEEEIAKKLKAKRFKKEEIYPAKLISPAQALKKEGMTDTQRKNILEMISEVAGKMTLKKVSYEKPTVEQMFIEVPKKQDEISFL